MWCLMGSALHTAGKAADTAILDPAHSMSMHIQNGFCCFDDTRHAAHGDLSLQMCFHVGVAIVGASLPAVYEAVLVCCLRSHTVLLQQGQSAADMPPAG